MLDIGTDGLGNVLEQKDAASFDRNEFKDTQKI